MEAAALIRMVASLGLILGVLAGVLWAVRRFDLKLPGRTLAHGRLAVVERLSLDPKRSVVLIRRDDREHLLLIAPDGTVTIETGIAAPSPSPDVAVARPSFAALVDAGVANFSRKRRALRNGEPCDLG